MKQSILTVMAAFSISACNVGTSTFGTELKNKIENPGNAEWYIYECKVMQTTKHVLFRTKPLLLEFRDGTATLILQTGNERDRFISSPDDDYVAPLSALDTDRFEYEISSTSGSAKTKIKVIAPKNMARGALRATVEVLPVRSEFRPQTLACKSLG